MANYNKPFLTYGEQIARLEERGIIIDSREQAISFLRNVNYYKFSGYTLFFEKRDNNNNLERVHQYQKGLKISDIIDLYIFDKNLRFLVWKALNDIEVSVKTRFAHIIASEKGAFALHEEKNFINKEDFLAVEEELCKAIETNKKETFVRHHIKKYGDIDCFPIWKITEILTFGAVSKIYSDLSLDLQDKISKDCGLTIRAYKTWVHSFVLVRNICAHNARLWNREMSIYPYLFSDWQFLKNMSKRIGPVLFCIKEMQRKHNIENSVWKKEIENLINKFNCSYREKFLQAIGLFEGWEKSELWKR